jgi:hypothetical protein
MATLRDSVIRLAAEHPELRKHLVPLLRQGNEAVQMLVVPMGGVDWTFSSLSEEPTAQDMARVSKASRVLMLAKQDPRLKPLLLLRLFKRLLPLDGGAIQLDPKNPIQYRDMLDAAGWEQSGQQFAGRRTFKHPESESTFMVADRDTFVFLLDAEKRNLVQQDEVED